MSLFHLKTGKEFVVKEIFKLILGIINSHETNYNNYENIDALDIGCASGEWLYYLKQSIKNNGCFMGVDISQELIDNAIERFGDKDFKWQQGNIQTVELGQKFHLITAMSVLSYFEDPILFLNSLLKYLHDDGIAIISGLFNDYGFDVRIQYKHMDDDQWHSGFNQISIHHIIKNLNILGYQTDVIEQIMPFELEPKENKLRSWTVMCNDIRYHTNGLHLLYNIKILKIFKKSK